MKGAGHFALGFLVGYLAVLVATAAGRALWWRVYGPFVPFGLGAWAALPYALQVAGVVDAARPLGPVWNVFLLYPTLEHGVLIKQVFGLFHVSAGLVGLAFSHLAWRYIKLIKDTRSAHAE